MTFNQLARIEPRLGDLEARAIAAHERGQWSAWEAIRRELGRCVGGDHGFAGGPARRGGEPHRRDRGSPKWGYA